MSYCRVSTSQQGNAARRRNPISSTVQALTRLERRRVMRSVIAEKVLVATQSWWREAIDDYRFGNSLHFQSSSLDPAIYYRRAKEWNLYADARDEDRLPSESYFSRFYRPHELTELDNLLQMDCFAVTEVSHRVLHSSTDKSAVAESGAKDATPSEKTGNAGGGGGGDASLLANIFYFPGLLSATVVGGKPAAQNANGEGENENVEDLAPEYTEAVQVLRAAAASAHNVDPNDPSVAAANALDLTLSTRSVSQRPSHRGVEMREDQLFAYDIPLTSTSSKPTTAATAAANDPSSGLQDSAQVNAQSSGFTLGRVVREIGMKARNIVGSGFNFLRRDDGGNSSDPLKRTSSTAGNRLLSSRASTDLSWITQADASISKASYSMYQQYAASYADSTLLLFDRSAPMWKAERAGLSPLLEEASIMTHSLYDSFAVSEEYRTLLKDHVIHLDDVANMEQLARDAHLAREITKGVYAGLPQSYSATLAVGFLQLSMVWVEGELLRWSDALEPSIITSTSTAATGNAPGLPASHARVFHSPFPTASQLVGEPSTPPRAGAPGTVPPINTTNEQSTERLGGLGGFHDHAERREQVARALSSQIASRLQERVRECVAQQNRVRFSNFRQHLLVSVEPIEAKIGVASNSIVVAVATGLENELRKIVNNHLFQQYTYSKEISADRLSLRLAGYTSVQTVTAYISQFDTDLVASDWDTMIYMLKDSPSYYMGFKEVHALQPQLHATLRLFQHKKRAYLAEQEKKRQPSADDSKKKKGAEGGEGAADEDKEMRAMRRQSYRKVRLTQAERERELRTPQRSGSIYSSRYGLPPGPGLTQTPSQASQSISSQLGIYNAILEEDLRTDFTSLSLDYTASLDAATSSYPFAVFPYQPEPYRIADHDYQGFAQLSQDLYARSTNPHLHLNEVAVRRFQDALLRQEKAALDDLVPAY